MTPADIAFRIALLAMCGFSLFAVAFLVWMLVHARFPLLGLSRPKSAKAPAGQGGKPPVQAPIAKPVIDAPRPPEQVRMVGENVAIGENPRSRIVLKP